MTYKRPLLLFLIIEADYDEIFCENVLRKFVDAPQGGI